MLRLAVVLLLLAMPAGAAAAVQDSIAAARDLYTTADYREALAMLTRLRPAATAPADARAIDQYRAFALFALGQTAEAELVVEGIALRRSDLDAAGGRGAAAHRGAVRPGARAGAAGRAAAAAGGGPGALRREELRRVGRGVHRRAAAARAIRRWRGPPAPTSPSVTALATGFRDLSLAAGRAGPGRRGRAPAEPPSTPLAAATPPATDGVAVAASPSPAPAPIRRRRRPPPSADRGDDAAEPAAAGRRPTSSPPVAIAQAIPRATDVTVPLGGAQTILLDIVIDETGRVERAEVRRSVNRLYEAQLVAATRGWRYTPATQGGRPVKYERTLEVTLNPRD